MKNLYLENTGGHHSKFYHMIENKDGVSFTASWGRIGSQGRTQIYDMSEWDKIHRGKIKKGYKSQHHNNPTNWIHGMSNTKKQLHKKVDKKVKVLDFKKRKVVGEKLLRLRSRIEDWTSINGWENQDNQAERKNKDGEVVWKRGDWEFVDDMYGIIINGGEFWWDKETYKKVMYPGAEKLGTSAEVGEEVSVMAVPAAFSLFSHGENKGGPGCRLQIFCQIRKPPITNFDLY